MRPSRGRGFLVSWTVTDDDNDVIHVRASINTKTEANEARDLIAALEKRLTKEPVNDRPNADV